MHWIGVHWIGSSLAGVRRWLRAIRLYLSGLEPDVTEQLRRTGQLGGHLHAYEADPVIGESTLRPIATPRRGSSKSTANDPAPVSRGLTGRGQHH
jgi:hypothetical protein